MGDAAPCAAVDRLHRVTNFAQRFAAELREAQLIRRPFVVVVVVFRQTAHE